MPTSAGAPGDYADELDLQRYREFLARHWKVLAAATVTASLVAIGVASMRAPVFQATATLVPLSGTPMPPGLTAATAKAFLISPQIASETVNELGLAGNGVTTARLLDAVDVQVSGANVIVLSVALPDPTKARLATELLASKAVDARRRADQQTAAVMRSGLEKSLSDADRDLRQAEERLSTFQATSGLDALEEQAQAANERRAKSDDIAIQLESERARLATLEAQLAGQPADASVAPLARPSSEDHAGATAAEPRGAVPPASSVRALLQYDIARTKATIAGLVREQRQTLASTSARETDKLNELYRGRLTLARLKAEYDARARAYNAVLLRYDEANPSSTASQLQILSRPVQPDAPVSKQRRRFGALGGLFGLACGVLAALIMDLRHRRHDTPLESARPRPTAEIG